MIEAFQFISLPDLLPSRKEIAGSLFNALSTRMETLSSEILESASAVTLIYDGWKNSRNVGVVNIIALIPGKKPLLLKSLEQVSRVTADYYASLVRTEIEKIGSHKVIALVTDNGSEMLAS